MTDERFFKHPALPFAEVRHSKRSGRHHKLHLHRTVSIGAIDQGEVVYRVGGRTAALRPGSLAVVNPETLHACNPAGSAKRSYYMLHLDVARCRQLQQSLWPRETFCPARTPIVEDHAVYQQVVGAMESLLAPGDPSRKAQRLAEAVRAVFAQACDPAAPPERLPSPQIERMKSLLGAGSDDGPTLRQLAATLQANPFTLLRQFKAATGLPPHAYRLNCRIERARKLLQAGGAPAAAS